jgi:hypothetical protein
MPFDISKFQRIPENFFLPPWILSRVAADDGDRFNICEARTLVRVKAQAQVQQKGRREPAFSEYL